MTDMEIADWFVRKLKEKYKSHPIEDKIKNTISTDDITKETEKAVLVCYTYEFTALDGPHPNTAEEVWIPKSCLKEKKGE